MANIKPAEISAIIKNQLTGSKVGPSLDEVGTVLQVGDGIARVYGLSNVQYGELVQFDNGMEGIVLNLEEDNVGVVLLGPSKEIKEGDTVKRTNRIASINVGEGVVGRVVNTLGQPIDGKGKIEGKMYEMPLERKAPGVIYRQPVNEPLQTGIKSIDAMIPIGRGQRELVIGDRQTGKTTVCIDTILNQKEFFDAGEPVYCIYVAIGQKASTRSYKSSNFNLPSSNFLPSPESKLSYLFLSISDKGESVSNLSAIKSALAKVSAPPICAKNKSSESVEFLLNLASKFIPPPFNPPAFKNTNIASVVS